jgi:hypothetical protein
MKTPNKWKKWIAGVLEGWSDAVTDHAHHSNTPPLRHSNSLSLHPSIFPLLPLAVWALLLCGVSSQCLAQCCPPVITNQPQSQAVSVGSSVSFTVGVDSTTFPTYQWRFNGGNISGATSSTFSIGYVQTNHAGNYSVTITNAAGWAISSNATLTVLGSSTVQFGASSYWFNQTDFYAIIAVSRAGGSSGSCSVHYATADGTATNGVDYDQRSDILTWDDGDTATKFLSVPLINNNLSGGSRYFTIDLSDPFSVSLGNPSSTTVRIVQPPLITDQPQSLAVTRGGTAFFTVMADSSAPLDYQWRFNGTNLSTATNSSFSIDNVQFLHAGAYSVEVSNAAGSTSSDDAFLNVLAPVFLSNPTLTTDHNFQFILNGPSGTYIIEIATNPASWKPYSTNVVPQSGTLLFTDTAVNFGRHFYRARLQ